jgi:predicted acyl esterase
LQKRFFDYFLKNIDNGWNKEPRVRLQVRHVDKFVERTENEWPIVRTRWTKLYLDPIAQSLSWAPITTGGTVRFDAMGDGITFLSPPLDRETEITGPSAAKLFISSSTADADIFVVLRVFSSDGAEVVFQGAIDPHTPIAQGWLRASHRMLDLELSTLYRPYHAHGEKQPLRLDEIVEMVIEIWPTSIVIPAGYRIALTVRGKDYEYPGASGGRIASFKNELRGCGPFLHNDPRDRPPEIFAGKTTLHTGPGRHCYMVLPIIPHPIVASQDESVS